MSRYIDAEKLLKSLDSYKGTEDTLYYDEIQMYVQDTPTEDVVEVLHGHWCKTEEPLGWREVECMECSACKEDCIIDEDFSFEEASEFLEYCPYCGAKMDGKDEDNGNL